MTEMRGGLRRWWSRCALLVALTVLVGGPGAVPVGAPGLSISDRDLAAGRPTTRASAYALPLPGPMHVLRRFEPPPTPYSAGHRGVDLEAGPGAGPVVLAAGSGVVSFAGPVAGRGVVVIAHPDGIRTEYEPVTALVVAGQAVTRGQPIARLAGRHDRWPPDRCLHWGARRGDTYLDPLLLLRPLGPVRLLPWPRRGDAGPHHEVVHPSVRQ